MPNEELLVWYGEGYAEDLGIDLEHDPNMPVVDPSKCSLFICNFLLHFYVLRMLVLMLSLGVDVLYKTYSF